jgi:hypothetical protein
LVKNATKPAKRAAEFCGLPAVRIAAIVAAAMAYASPIERGDGRLLAMALGLSLLGNVGLLALLTVAGQILSRNRQDTPPAPPAERIIVFRTEAATEAESLPEAAETPSPQPVRRPFASTTAEQPAGLEDRPRFLGDRDTLASSSARPDADAPPLPAQAGRESRYKNEIETRQSDFQEGEAERPAAAVAETPPPAALAPESLSQPQRGSEASEEGESDRAAQLPREATPVELPNAVDVPVPLEPERPAPVADRLEQPREGLPEGASAAAAPQENTLSETPRPRPPIQDPAFRTQARKNEIRGSISRSGSGSLDVENTPLGRYRATVMKAIEQEWQRAAVRHRDYIQPGFLTVRFFIDPDGKVRSVQFLSEMDTGQIQKGFTHSSIRDAKIGAMPPAVREALGGEPLELIINFYF